MIDVTPLRILRAFGLLFLAIAVWTALEGLVFPGGPLFLFGQAHISPDGVIERPGHFYVGISLGLSWFAALSLLNAGNRELAGKEVWANCGVIAVLACIGCFFTTSHRLPGLHLELYREDGFFENMTFVLFAVSALGFWAASGKTNSGRCWRPRWALRIFALGSLFIAMEEISWGQRIFSWETPTLWKEINFQGETTVHNLVTLESVRYVTKIGPVMIIAVLIGFSIQLRECVDGTSLTPLLPGKKLWCFSYLLPVICVFYNELFEEIIAVVTFAYSIELAGPIGRPSVGQRLDAFDWEIWAGTRSPRWEASSFGNSSTQ